MYCRAPARLSPASLAYSVGGPQVSIATAADLTQVNPLKLIKLHFVQPGRSLNKLHFWRDGVGQT